MINIKNEKKHTHLFWKRLTRSLLIAALIVSSSLFIGMCGYHYFEHLSWLDAFVDAAMILSGMGPVRPPVTFEGKLFAGSYALFSGIIFLITVGIIFAPIFHKFLHHFNIEEDNKK